MRIHIFYRRFDLVFWTCVLRWASPNEPKFHKISKKLIPAVTSRSKGCSFVFHFFSFPSTILQLIRNQVELGSQLKSRATFSGNQTVSCLVCDHRCNVWERKTPDLSSLTSSAIQNHVIYLTAPAWTTLLWTLINR